QHLLLGLAEGFADRQQHLLDRFLAFGERRSRRLLMLAEMLARELQEYLAVGAQRRSGDAVERRLQSLDRALERGLSFALDLFLGLDLRLEHRELDVQGLVAPA